MIPQELIRKKRDGLELTLPEIEFLVGAKRSHPLFLSPSAQAGAPKDGWTPVMVVDARKVTSSGYVPEDFVQLLVAEKR